MTVLSLGRNKSLRDLGFLVACSLNLESHCSFLGTFFVFSLCFCFCLLFYCYMEDFQTLGEVLEGKCRQTGFLFLFF